jgi:hypothetical protein
MNFISADVTLQKKIVFCLSCTRRRRLVARVYMNLIRDTNDCCSMYTMSFGMWGCDCKSCATALHAISSQSNKDSI